MEKNMENQNDGDMATATYKRSQIWGKVFGSSR